MERIKQYVGEKYRQHKESVAVKEENERKMRVSAHPHNPGCTMSKDIEFFDKEYSSGGGHTMYKFVVLISYTTRCQECGCEDHSHKH